MWQNADKTPSPSSPFKGATDVKGDEIQKLNEIQSLPNLLAGDAQSCLNKVLPKMQESLPTASTEFHIAASAAFKTILEQKLVPHTTFTQIFLQSILISLDNKDIVIAHYWLKTLLDVIELLPEDVVEHEILPVSINKGQLSQPMSSRVMCCKLLGKICTRLDSITIKKEVLPTVLSLCQDANNDVRACMCSQLYYVAVGLGAESTKQLLLPSLVDLASDEAYFVKKESVPTIVALLPQLQQDTITGIIIPLVKKICDNALKSDDDDMIYIVAGELGNLALGMEKYLTEDEKSWFIKFYQVLAKVESPYINKDDPTKQELPYTRSHKIKVFLRHIECRRLCAVNIPAMLTFASRTKEGANVLLPIFKDLSTDPYFMVRKTVGSCIHDVAEIMISCCGLIEAEFIKLLNDDSQDVLQEIVPNLAQTMQCLMQNKTNSPDYDSDSMPICRALLKCENEIASTNNWRLSAMMWTQLEILPKYFSSDIIYKFFVPVVINRILNARPLPVRLAAGRTLLIFLRYNLNSQQRMKIRSRLQEMVNTNNCYVRILYLRLMEEALSIFSAEYIKEHFYNSILGLQNDRVANIRLKLVSLLPALKKSLCLPTDDILLTTLETMVQNYTRDEQDRDVKDTLKNVIKELNVIELPHDGQITSCKGIKQDPENIKKYSEEIKLAGTSSVKVINQHSNIGLFEKKHSPVPKLSTISAKTFEDLSASKPTRQGSLQYQFSSSSTPSTPKENQITSSIGLSDKSKLTGIKLPTTSRYDSLKASSSSFDLTTNWTRLTSNSMLLSKPWEPLTYVPTDTTFNIDSTSNLITLTDAVYQDYLSKIGNSCNCCPLDLILRPRDLSLTSDDPKTSYSYLDDYNGLLGTNSPTSSTNIPMSTSTTITTPATITSASSPESRRNVLHNFLLTRPSLSKDSFSPQNNYNPHWAFRSEMPLNSTSAPTLLNDEFIVDAGISIPQLKSSQSASKIPSSTFDYQSHSSRTWIESNFGKKSFNVKEARTKHFSMEYEDYLKQCNEEGKILVKDYNRELDWEVKTRPKSAFGTSQSTRQKMNGSKDSFYGKMDDEFIMDAGISMPQTKLSQSGSKISSSIFDYQNHTSGVSIESNFTTKNNFNAKEPRTRHFSIEYEDSLKQQTEEGKTFDKEYKNDQDWQVKTRSKSAFGSSQSTRQKISDSKDGLYVDKLQSIQNKNSIDRWKRHSMSFAYKGSSTDESVYKRYSSIALSNYSERPRLVKQSTYHDVNHNQEISFIPLRTDRQVYGSRTAPATRASSPIRFEQRLRFEQIDDIRAGIEDRLSPDQKLNLDTKSKLQKMKHSSSDEEIDKLYQKPRQETASLRGRGSRLPVRAKLGGKI